MSTPQFSSRVVQPGEQDAVIDATAGVTPVVSDNNAIVPDNMAIRPPQAFVNVFAAVMAATGTNDQWYALLSGKGITEIDPQVLVDAVNGNDTNLDLSDNALTNVDAILTALALASRAGDPHTIDLSGGANAEPTDGADNAYIATMVGAGWTVTVNVDDAPQTFAPEEP